MTGSPATKSQQTAAAETAPFMEREVYARDHAGGAGRIPLNVAEALVSRGLADRVSRAGHVRLKPGINIEKINSYHGATPNATTRGHRQEKLDHRYERCALWRSPA